MSDRLSPPEALIYAMVAVSAADRKISDRRDFAHRLDRARAAAPSSSTTATGWPARRKSAASCSTSRMASRRCSRWSRTACRLIFTRRPMCSRRRSRRPTSSTMTRRSASWRCWRRSSVSTSSRAPRSSGRRRRATRRFDVLRKLFTEGGDCVRGGGEIGVMGAWPARLQVVIAIGAATQGGSIARVHSRRPRFACRTGRARPGRSARDSSSVSRWLVRSLSGFPGGWNG